MKKFGFTLAEVFCPAEQSRKFGFTLAEVLITLGIIGVVAALTMPSLIQHHQEKETVTRLKKVYSILSQALLIAVAENGTVDQWGLKTTIQGSNDDGEIVTDESGIENFTAIFSKYLKGELLNVGWDKDLDLTNMQKVSLTVADGVINYAPVDKKAPTAIKLNDGTILSFGQINNNQSCADNNFENGDYCSGITAYFPNKQGTMSQGRNHFNFYVMKNRIIPWGAQGDWHNPFDSHCKKSVNNRFSGRGCTAWVIYNENMDYLHCDDLSWSGKRQCK